MIGVMPTKDKTHTYGTNTMPGQAVPGEAPRQEQAKIIRPANKGEILPKTNKLKKT